MSMLFSRSTPTFNVTKTSRKPTRLPSSWYWPGRNETVREVSVPRRATRLMVISVSPSEAIVTGRGVLAFSTTFAARFHKASSLGMAPFPSASVKAAESFKAAYASLTVVCASPKIVGSTSLADFSTMVLSREKRSAIGSALASPSDA